MIREDLPAAGKGGDFGPLIRWAFIGTFAVAGFLGNQPGAQAQAEPYCPRVSEQARALYDIDKWCASVNEDLRQGRTPDLAKRLEQSRRQPAVTDSATSARPQATSNGSVATVKPSTRPTSSPSGGDSRPQHRSPEETARQAHSGSASSEDSTGDSSTKGGRERKLRSTEPSALPITTLPPSPPSPAYGPNAVPVQTPMAEPRPQGEATGTLTVTGPLGGAMLFGLMVMALSAVGIRQSRLRAGHAVVVEGLPVERAAGRRRFAESGQRAAAVVVTGSAPPVGAEPAGAADGSLGEAGSEYGRGGSLDAVAAATVPAVPLIGAAPVNGTSPATNDSEKGAAPSGLGEAENAPDQGAARSSTPVAATSAFVAGPGRAKAEVLGLARLSYAGKEVSFGRAEACDLFALLSTSREGVLTQSVIDTLWPGEGERGARRLESAIRDVNGAMRQVTGLAATVKFVVKAGSRRRLAAAYFDVDFWRFEDAYKVATTTEEDVTRAAALHDMLALYQGPLLAQRDDLWCLPLRQAAQTRAVHAATRLAELERKRDPDRALDVLTLAVDRVDPHSEVLWCQLMTIQGELGRLPAVRRSFEQLKERLAELDAVPSAQARQTYERLIR